MNLAEQRVLNLLSYTPNFMDTLDIFRDYNKMYTNPETNEQIRRALDDLVYSGHLKYRAGGEYQIKTGLHERVRAWKLEMKSVPKPAKLEETPSVIAETMTMEDDNTPTAPTPPPTKKQKKSAPAPESKPEPKAEAKPDGEAPVQ